MAGIGFEIRKMLGEESYSGLVRAYAYSAMVASGPWIISILTIVVLNYFLHQSFATAEIALFTSTITHVFAFSLILVGPFGLVLTRFAADRFSDKKPEEIFPSFMAALTLVAAVAAIVGVVFFGFGVGGTLIYQISAAALMVYVCCIFITANYLTALLDYRDVVTNFLIGYAVSGLAALLFASWLGMSAALFGFASGQLLLLVLLFRSLKSELGHKVIPSWNVLGYFRRFPSLMLVGLLYNLGIWIDKLIFWWFSEQHVQVRGWMYAAPEYDVGIYLSLLSIVPGMAVFFLNVETGFAERFSAFFQTVERGGTLERIGQARREISIVLRRGMLSLIKVQGVVTIFLAVFAGQILSALNVGSMQMGIFRVTLFGAFLLVLFLSLLTVLFYFDDRRGALLCTSVFVVANATLSLALSGNEKWFGVGFVVAAGLAMVIAGRRVNGRLDDLEYQVFCRGT